MCKLCTATELRDRLRDLGLRPKLVNDLEAMGTEGIPLAERILAGGPDAVRRINEVADRV